MSVKNAVNNPQSKWMQGDGPEADVVVSSRIRLARNLQNYPFPHSITEKASRQVLNAVKNAIENKLFLKYFGVLDFAHLESLSSVERQVLVEKHLMSPEQLENTLYRGIALSEDEGLSIMVNEEDHLRIQVFLPGLQLEEAWGTATDVDDTLERVLDYSFSEKQGYLTACPTNVGTGLRASVMVHLPALVLVGQINNIITAISQLGLVVRGYHGEGTKAIGHLFQISNQLTLGQTEEEIIKNLGTVTNQIINQERSARTVLYRDNKIQLEDKIYRSLGILTYARLVTSEEALGMLSDLRLGLALGVTKGTIIETINELMIMTKSGFMQKMAGKEMASQERDMERARIIRSKLEKIIK